VACAIPSAGQARLSLARPRPSAMVIAAGGVLGPELHVLRD
jgi:hypothetical protein